MSPSSSPSAVSITLPHKWVPNAFDEYAVETALRLAEVVGGTQRLAEVIVLSICPEDSAST
jgi:electron transfer flavoprotein alpha/beta subunit